MIKESKFDLSKADFIKSLVLEKICNIINRDGYGFIKNSSSPDVSSIMCVLINKYDFETTDHGHHIFMKKNNKNRIINIDDLLFSMNTLCEQSNK